MDRISEPVCKGRLVLTASLWEDTRNDSITLPSHLSEEKITQYSLLGSLKHNKRNPENKRDTEKPLSADRVLSVVTGLAQRCSPDLPTH